MPQANTDKNVYILGAGFSKEIGLPLQDDFLLLAKEVFFRNTDKYKHFETVFNYQNKLTKMRQFLSYPTLNLEHLFNLMEMDIFYSKSKEIGSIRKDFIDLICDVLKEQTPNPYYNDKNGKLKQSSEYNDYLNFLRLFIFSDNHSSVQTYGDTIITFNYDLVLEATATIYNRNRAEKGKNIGFAFNTMFGKSNIVSDDINRYFIKNGQHDFFPAIDIFSEEASAINLIKLHGSINWKLNNDNNKTFIVPPTWNKSDTEIRKLWNLAYEELTKAKRIIIIGYSFPEIDIYVKSLIALALNENSIIQNIYFINPDSENAKKNSLSLLDKHFEKYCDYKEWKFSYLMNSEEGKNFMRNELNRIF